GADVVAEDPGGVRGHRVAAVDTGALHMLHESRDDHRVAVADRIDVDLGAEEVSIDEHRAAAVRTLGGERRHRGLEISLQLATTVHDLHRPPAEHVPRAHQDPE